MLSGFKYFFIITGMLLLSCNHDHKFTIDFKEGRGRFQGLCLKDFKILNIFSVIFGIK